MITLNSCPVCKSDRITQYNQAGLAPRISHEIMPGVKVNVAIISCYFICQSCGLIFQNPRMSDKELSNFYGKGYYRRTLNLTDEEKDVDEMNRARIDSGIIKEYLGQVGSHLDVGCSRGYLLKLVGAEVKVGVEEDVNGMTEKGVEVYQKIGEVPQKSFDLVTVIHTLEHVTDPVSYLKNMAKFIGKEGYLVLEVPTWKSPGGPLRLAHLYHFEPDVLRLLCRKVGLKIVETKFTPHLLLICRKVEET